MIAQPRLFYWRAAGRRQKFRTFSKTGAVDWCVRTFSASAGIKLQLLHRKLASFKHRMPVAVAAAAAQSGTGDLVVVELSAPLRASLHGMKSFLLWRPPVGVDGVDASTFYAFRNWFQRKGKTAKLFGTNFNATWLRDVDTTEDAIDARRCTEHRLH